MKKLLLLVFMLLLIAPANAYYYGSRPGFNYSNSFGVRNYNNPNNFGSNAPFAQQNIDRAIMRQRQNDYEKKYLESLKNTQNINVNVNHNGIPGNTLLPPPEYYNNSYNTNSYYNNGYNRYYNNNYVPSSGIYYHRGNSMTIPGVRMY